MSKVFRRKDGQILVVPWRTVQHLIAHPDISDALIDEVFQAIPILEGRQSIVEEVDLGRVIGLTSKVATTPISLGDVTLFSYRTKRRYPSRVVVGQPKIDSSSATVVIERQKSGDLYLETAYIGTSAPPELLSSKARNKGVTKIEYAEFWCRHALIYEPDLCETLPFECSWQALIDRRNMLGPDS